MQDLWNKTKVSSILVSTLIANVLFANYEKLLLTKWTNEDRKIPDHQLNCDCVGCIKKRSKFRMNNGQPII